MNKKYTIFIISIFLTSSFLVLNNLSVSKLPVDTSQKNTQIKANHKVNRESKAKTNVNKQSKSKIGELPLSAKSQTSYTNHIPIIIFGDSGFSTVSGITGSGTSSDPYVINGFNITSTGTLISIQNTDKYVLIENCWLDGEQDPNSIGINLSKTLQVTIEFNEIYYLSEGIWGTSANYTNIGWNNIVLGTPYGDSVNIANSFSVQLTQNLVDSVTSNSGFYIASTLNVYINKNNIYNVNEGIIGINDDRLEVIGNKIEVPSIGIDIEGGVDFVTIENNTLISPTNIAVNQPTNIGIQIMYLFVGSFLNNAITNADTSMLFLGSSNNIIEGNNITNSLTDALDIGSSNNNLVKGNVITDSGAHGIYILSSKKNNIINNTISGLI